MTSWEHQESGESEFKLLKAKLALRFVPLQQLCFERLGWIRPPSTPVVVLLPLDSHLSGGIADHHEVSWRDEHQLRQPAV